VKITTGSTTATLPDAASAPPAGHGQAEAGGPTGLRRRRPEWLWAALAVAVPVTATVLLRLDRLVVNSDSVAQQSVVGTWLRVGHDVTYVPQDTWLLKLPLYLAVEQLPLSPRARLALESVALLLAGLGLLGLAVRAVLRQARTAGPNARWPDVALPLAWLGTLGGVLGQLWATMPNYRNVELGWVFGLLAALGAVASGRLPRRLFGGRRVRGARGVAVLAGGVAAAALLWVDDPYFAYLLGAPLVPGALVWALRRSRGGGGRRGVAAAGLVAASLALAAALRALLPLAGVRVVLDDERTPLSPTLIADHLRLLWPALAVHLGLPRSAEPGASIGSASGIAGVAALGILVAGVVASGYLARRGWQAGSLPLTTIALGWPVVVAGMVCHPAALDLLSGRYLVLAVVELAVTLGLAAAFLRPRRPWLAGAIVGALAVATVANGAAVVLDRGPRPPETAAQDATATLLRTMGGGDGRVAPIRGYAEFWDADLYTWLTGGDVQLSEVQCAGHRLRYRYWLTDTARSRVRSRHAVVLWNEASPKAGGCSVADLVAQLGAPSRTVPAPAGGVVLDFPGEAARRIDPATLS